MLAELDSFPPASTREPVYVQGIIVQLPGPLKENRVTWPAGQPDQLNQGYGSLQHRLTPLIVKTCFSLVNHYWLIDNCTNERWVSANLSNQASAAKNAASPRSELASIVKRYKLTFLFYVVLFFILSSLLYDC